jgi:uncharacterized protein (UPF0332 family)
MPKVENMVKWCLDKAKKEVQKGQKHRGLVRVNPDLRLAQEHIKKAEHNLEVFLANKKLGFYDWTINIGFYVMYHCCLSILAKFGYESRNQECTLALIESLAKDKKIDENFKKYIESIRSSSIDEGDKLMPMREKYQYTTIIEIDIKKVEEILGMCQDMIKDTKGIIT